MRGAGWLAIAMMAACGADESEQLDGGHDAPEEDAAIDAATDTPTDPPRPNPEPTTARIGLFEVDQLDPLGDGSHGQGLIGSVYFEHLDAVVDPIYDSNPGTIFGCKTWRLTRAQAAAMIGIDEGDVQFTVPGPNPPAIEPCTFAAGIGYTCPGATAVTPGLADPGVLPDMQAFEASLTAGGSNDVASFVAAGQEVGDDFTLTPASLALLENIPRDGSMFTVACDPTSCPSGSGIGTELEIVTTDAAVSGLSPFELPLPTSVQVITRCMELSQTAATITVPAAHSALLMGSSATRIRATFRRMNFAGPSPAISNVLVMAGHAITGISNSN